MSHVAGEEASSELMDRIECLGEFCGGGDVNGGGLK